MRPKFIVLEGIDGSGTTTQARRLCADIGAVFTCEPTDMKTGALIRKSLSASDPYRVGDEALALLFAADRQEHLKWIQHLLDDGTPVVSDRYMWSTLAYQGLTLADHWLEQINPRLLVPDLTILLDIDPHIAADRRAKRGGDEDQFDDYSTQRQLREKYQSIYYRCTHRTAMIDANGSEDEVARCIATAVSRIPENPPPQM